MRSKNFNKMLALVLSVVTTSSAMSTVLAVPNADITKTEGSKVQVEDASDADTTTKSKASEEAKQKAETNKTQAKDDSDTALDAIAAHTASKTAIQEAKEQDFTSKELIIKISDENAVSDEYIVDSYQDVYLMRFDSKEDTERAFKYYYDNTQNREEFVATNDSFAIAAETTGQAEETSSESLTMLSSNIEDISKEDISKAKTIALIDTGVKKSSVTDAVSMLGDNTEDLNGHGDSMVEFIRSQNKDASIISIKAIDGNGRGDAASIYSAIEYAIAREVKIINLSLYGRNTENNAAIISAINDAIDAGITVVGAAGNDGKDVKAYLPGNLEDVYVIGACDENGIRLKTSNYGETVDYNVVSDSTSEATAKFSGYISANKIDSIADVLNKGLIYLTDYKPSETETKGDGSKNLAGDSEEGFKPAGAVTITKNGAQKLGTNKFNMSLNEKKITYANMKVLSSSAYLSKTARTTINLDDTTKTTYGIFWSNGSKTTVGDLKNYWIASGDDTYWNTPGDITLQFADGVKAGDKYYPLKITITNIRIRRYTDSTKWNGNHVSILNGGTSQNGTLKFTAPLGAEVAMTATFEAVGAPTASKMALNYGDIDTRGVHSSGGNPTRYYPYGSGDVGNGNLIGWQSGTESIYTYSGINNAFIDKNSYLAYGTTSSGNSGFLGTQAVDNGDTRGAVTLLGGTSMQVRWAGTHCQTTLGGLSDFANYPVNTYVSYQNADGSWDNYTQVGSSQTYYCYQDAGYSVVFTKKAGPYGTPYISSASSGVTNAAVSDTAVTANVYSGGTSPLSIYVRVPRTTVTYSFDYNIPKALTDAGWDEAKLRYGGRLSGTQNEFTKYYGANADDVTGLTLKSFIFKGWNSKADGTGEWYTDSETTTSGAVGTTFKVMDADRTFYAIWDNPIYAADPLVTVQVRYQKADGTWGSYSKLVDAQTVKYYSDYSYTYNVPSNQYTLYASKIEQSRVNANSGNTVTLTDDDSTKADIEITDMGNNETINIDVYRKSYTYTFDLNPQTCPVDGASMDPKKITNAQEDIAKLAENMSGDVKSPAYSEGWTFVEWNSKADGTGISYSSESMVSNKTWYAQWKQDLGNETITIVSEETGNPVPGVKIQLYNKTTGQPDGPARITDGKGQVKVDNQHWFDYTWKCVEVPAGYQKFDDVNYNINWNHLVNTDEVILYMKHVQVVLDSKVTEIILGESAPSFMYHIEGTDVAGVKHSYDVMVDVDGKTLTGSNATKDMFAGTYKVTQIGNERYIADSAQNVSNSTPDGVNTTVDVVNNPKAEVLFPYHIKNYGWFTSMHSAVNALHK